MTEKTQSTQQKMGTVHVRRQSMGKKDSGKFWHPCLIYLK